MQISDRDIIDWLLGITAALGAIFIALYWYIWKGDRSRLKALEEAHTKLEALVALSVTKPEAEHLFEKAKETYQTEHSDILGEIVSLREDIIKAINQPWRGEERRRK